jgi:hypothetical protein
MAPGGTLDIAPLLAPQAHCLRKEPKPRHSIVTAMGYLRWSMGLSGQFIHVDKLPRADGRQPDRCRGSVGTTTHRSGGPDDWRRGITVGSWVHAIA